MYKSIKFKVVGVSPLLMHNGQLSDPLNEFTRELKKATSKKKKTDADHEEMARLEFLGSLYVNEKGEPCIPAENVESMLCEAARKTKSGKLAKSGLMVEQEAKLQYTGPKKGEDLWGLAVPKKKGFVSRMRVRVQQAAVMRTRPIFREWATEFVVSYNINVLDAEQIREFVTTAGVLVGLGDYRPKYGRFNVA